MKHMVEIDQKNQSVITAVKLTKVFRDFWMREKVTAVSELDLVINQHEVFGLLGPNGSGKSTTIKMILGLLFPTRGRISIYGKRPTDVAVKARIGFLPEESYLYPFLNARETLDFYGRLFHQNRSERNRRIDMLLDMVGLSSVAYRRVGEYSKGMQRRIGLAQALINDPDLLILDEPTSGMDPVGTRQFKDLIRTLSQRGKTIILSSHLLGDVEDICDRVCILYGGKQRALGTMDDLLTKNTMTQITTPTLDEQILEKIRQVLAGAGLDILNVTTPRDKLESLFLRIVKEAQEQRVVTGGALAGGKVAEFLRTGEDGGRELITQLVSAAQAPILAKVEAVEPAISVAATVQTRKVVDELTSAATEAQDAPEQLAKPAQPATQRKVDKKIIGDLLGKNDEGSSE
jgi:ABC-2 type transport system ATP-binding protein